MTLGEKIRAGRTSLRLTQAELGERVGLTQRSILNIESEKTTPHMPAIRKLADVLGVSLQYLTTPEIDDPASGINQEIFLASAKAKFGYRGAKEATALLERSQVLFAGGDLSQEAKEVFFESLMRAYLEGKQTARERFGRKATGEPQDQ